VISENTLDVGAACALGGSIQTRLDSGGLNETCREPAFASALNAETDGQLRFEERQLAATLPDKPSSINRPLP